MFHPWAPASPFFLPKGATVYNLLISWIRELYVKYGYQEILTPQIFDEELFTTSGHTGNYRENMFFVQVDEEYVDLYCRTMAAEGTARIAPNWIAIS